MTSDPLTSRRQDARYWLGALLCTLSLPALSPAGDWIPMGRLNVPSHNYSYLAATPSGDLIATTFNNSSLSDPPRDIPVFLIKSPTTQQPLILELTRVSFDPQRGYGGVASDMNGAFFLTCDTGKNDSCTVRKYLPSGTPDTSFGEAGQIRPGRRCMGVDVLGHYLLLSVDWGQIQVYRSDTGAYHGTLASAPSNTLMHDIAIDPKSMRVFGVAQGAVLTWGSGAPWNYSAYQYRQLSQAYGQPRAPEGISIDPVERALLVTPVPGNTLFEVNGALQVTRTPITSASANTSLADTVLSFDGTTLFVSDQAGKTIHTLKRTIEQPEVIAGSPGALRRVAPALTAAPGGAAIPPPHWYSPYTDVVQSAREQGKPMLVYFRREGVKKANDFEATVLKSADFNQRAQRYICVYEDVSRNTMTAYKFGAYRVPYVAVLDRNGETAAEFAFNIDQEKLFQAMDTTQ